MRSPLRSLRRSLRARLATSLLVCGVVLSVFAHFTVRGSLAPTLEENLRERGQSLLSAVHYAAETLPDRATLQRFVSALAAEKGIEQLGVVVGNPPRIIASNRGAWRGARVDVLPSELREEVTHVMADRATVDRSWTHDEKVHLDLVTAIRYSQVEFGESQELGAVFVRLEAHPLRGTLARATDRTSAILAVAFALFGLCGLLLIDWNVLSPLRRIGSAMDRRTSGEQEVFAPEDGEDEVGRLSTQLNSMLRSLDTARTDAELASRSKSEFLANMSHEIRTPMTAILGFADDLIESQRDPESETRRAALTIGRNCRHLLQLLDDILDVSKIEAGKVEVETIETELPQLLVDVHRLMRAKAKAEDLEFRLTFATPLPRVVRTDGTRIKQVLLNLVGNAIKFTERGAIELTANLIEGEGLPRIRLEVADTGIGMSPEQLERIFAPFSQADASTTRKFGGTGLGLTISRALTELLDGELTVRSTPNVGTTFRIDLPAEFDPAVPRIAAPTDLRGSAAIPRKKVEIPEIGARVLLAEDGLDNQILIGRLLERAACEVTIVGNGLLAVEALTAEGAAFDVVLMDMQMPEMDGYTATRTLRERGVTTPVIALTAHAMAGDRQKCLDAGCDGYATKPIDRQAFYDEIIAHVSPELTN